MATAKTSAKTTAKKTTASSAKKTGQTAKKTTAKKPAAAKKTSSSASRIQVTATEKKLVELYRNADSDTKKAAMALLKGEKSQLGGILESILENKTIMNTVTSLFK